jgi:hypothetical protein
MRRTTVRLDDALLDQVKREAARRGQNVTTLIEQGLRLVLAERPRRRRGPYVLPVSPQAGGMLPGVDLNDSADLLDILEGRR